MPQVLLGSLLEIEKVAAKQFKANVSKCFFFNCLLLSQLDKSSKRKHIKLKAVMDSDDNNALKCNQCEYTSSQSGHLRTHLRIHNGEKPNKCNQCDYASSYASALRRHLETHSGEKRYKCNQCNYAPSYASALGTHVKTHSGDKPNKCSQCDYASSDAGNLRAHLKTHIAEK